MSSKVVKTEAKSQECTNKRQAMSQLRRIK